MKNFVEIDWSKKKIYLSMVTVFIIVFEILVEHQLYIELLF